MARAKPRTEFEKLKAKWYGKLKKDGFEDIELDEDTLSTYSTEFVRKRAKNQNGGFQIKADYYYMANHFLNQYPFKTPLERIIWEYHANGISARNIAQLLTKARRKRVGRMTVWRVIDRLNIVMMKGLR